MKTMCALAVELLHMVMHNQFDNITLSLAGIIQAVALVRDLAQTGKIDEAAFKASIASIFQTDPHDVATIYGGKEGVRVGLESLIQLIDPVSKKNVPRSQTRYLLSLIHLQKKIYRNSAALNTLTERVNQIKKQVDYFSLTHSTVISNLADLYLNTISHFRFRIIIWGNQNILGVNENIDKIRALLLAGIRSAVLWRQMGGSRLQLFFSRTKIRASAEKLLQRGF